MLTATTLGGWAVAIALALEHFGIDPEPLFIESDIDLTEARRAPFARIPIAQMSKLMRLAADSVNEPAFGLHVGRFMRPTSWHALGFSVWASQDLRRGFERLVRYKRIFTTCAEMRIVESDGVFSLQGSGLPEYQDVLQAEEYDAFIASVVLTCKHLCPNDFQLLKVEFPRPEPVDTSGFERMFKCPLVFNSDKVALHLTTELVDLPLATGNAELAQSNDKICEDYLARLDRDDVVTQVRHRLLEELQNGEPQMEQIAQALYLSPRTLQRKLNGKGTNFKSLLDSIRQELALQYLKQPHLPIGEISYRLGFSHISNFSRAFKRWMGTGPAEYREQQNV